MAHKEKIFIHDENTWLHEMEIPLLLIHSNFDILSHLRLRYSSFEAETGNTLLLNKEKHGSTFSVI